MKSCINGATTMPYSLEQDIAAAAQAGFEGLEIWWDKLVTYLDSHSTDDLKEIAGEQGSVPGEYLPVKDMALSRQ